MHRNQVGIAAAFAETVDGSLNVHRAGIDGGQGIGHGQVAVVMGVDAHGHAEGGKCGERRPGDLGDFLGHSAAVGVAKHDQPCAGLGGRVDCFQRIIGIGLVAVEKMFGIEKHLAPGGFQIGDAVGDHAQVLVERCADDLGGMEGR